MTNLTEYQRQHIIEMLEQGEDRVFLSTENRAIC